jgi:DNA-binding SARP family transcriptional activator
MSATDRHSSAPISRLHLRLVGGFDLQRDHVSLSVPQSAQRVLAYLAVHDPPAHRARVAGALWANGTEAQAAGCLRSALWRLRLIDGHIVERAGAQICLGAGVWVDLVEGYRLAQGLLNLEPWPGRQAEIDDANALKVLDGELLPDWYLDDWLMLHREQWRQLRLHALEVLAAEQAKRGAYAAAVQAALAAVRGDVLRESAHRCLISVHLAEGNVMEAVRAYQAFRSISLAELGVQPSERLTEMILAASSPAQLLDL